MIEFINFTFLQNIWFFLWCVIWSVYLIADSFVIGIGLLSIHKINNDYYIEAMRKSISPFCGGNQVWLILAAGGTFAAFPLIFSKMFTWLYLPMMLLLLGLVLRGLSIELLHHETESKLKKIYKLSFFIGSLIISVVLGLFFSNLFLGLLIGSNYTYYGTFFGLINKFTLFGTFLFISIFILSGSLWLSYKTNDPISKEYYEHSKKMSIVVSLSFILYIASLFNIKYFGVNYHRYQLLYIIPFLSIALSTLNFIMLNKFSNHGYKIKLYGFLINCLASIFLLLTGLVTLYPCILKSSIDISYGVSIYASSSSELTLLLMLISAIIFVPIVLIYQLYSYFIFNEKIN